MDESGRGARVALGILTGFTVVALIGFGVFGLRPDRLAALPAWLSGFYGVAFRFFAQGQVWLAGAVLGFYLTSRVGWRWVPALVVLYGLSLTSELLGTGLGIPFGAYSYSELLGARWLGRVPWVIPLSWFLMALPSYALAKLAHPRSVVARVGLASIILLSWDLALDPAMAWATRYWIWEDTGPYYGMPWLNLLGWYLTGVVLMSALAVLRADAWIDDLSPRWLGAYYGVNLLLPLGMCAVAGLGAAVMATVAALAVAGAWIRLRVDRRGPALRESVVAGGVR